MMKAAPIAAFLSAPLVCLTIPVAGSPQLDDQISHSGAAGRDNKRHSNSRNLKPKRQKS